MLFGSDKVPEIARTMGKAMAQLKNATNDIKSEIQKGAEDHGFDQKMLTDLTGSVTSEVDKVKANLIGDTNPLNGISDAFSSGIEKTKSSILDDTVPDVNKIAEDIEDATGPIKRQR
jgi:sec-independent protein translocase protein TatA